MISNLLSKLKAHKNLVIVLSCIFLALIIITIVIILTVNSLKNINKENTAQETTTQLELADDSETALLTDVQPYDISDGTPTFDLYGEVGYNLNNYPSVMVRSDYSSDAEACDSTDATNYNEKAEVREKCIVLSKEKLVIPNHATLQIYSGSYKSYPTDDKDYWHWALEYAYALLPDGSMVSMSKAKVQFNFYDNETRIVQMNGSAYYRVKAQPEGYKFTVQVGDRIIELSDSETQISIDLDKDTTNKNNMDSYDLIKSGEEDQELIEILQSNKYIVNIINYSGAGRMYKRGTTSENLVILDDGDNSYKRFSFYDYKTRKTTDATQKEYENNKETVLSSDYYNDHAMFSVNNYGLGNFNSVSVSDLYDMLMVYFDNAKIVEYKEAMKYKEDMDNFNTEWNNFITKIGQCNDGWYKTATGTCCPNGTVHNPSIGTCTKTTYYYYCDAGWTLGSDNMCHKAGSSSEETKTPVYNQNSGAGGGICVDSSKPASFQLCKMGVTLGTSKMSGSKCCFNEVAEPVLN